MARVPYRNVIVALLEKHERNIRKELLAAFDDIKDSIVLRVVVERLERGDVFGAIEAMHLDADAFARLEIAIADAYNAGGAAAVGDLPTLRDPAGNRVVFRWGTRNVYAERELREHSASLVSGILQDQRTGIQTALFEGLARGDNPTRTALNVVGRVSRVSGRREGGIIGLTAAQERFVARAREELGDPTRMRDYLARERRDKRFDAQVRAAMKAGKPLDVASIDKVTGRYSDRLLDLRGKTLALHETRVALDKSRFDAFRQQIDAGKIGEQDIVKVWRHSGSEHPRIQHIMMNRQEVPFDQPFTAPDGTHLMFPHDPAAPASHTIGCKCRVEYRIDYLGRAAREIRATAA